MVQDEDRGTLRVLVTSVDGNVDHPFRPGVTVGEVRAWAYNKLVQDKGAVSLESTWMEHRDSRLEDVTELSDIEREPTKTGKDPDIVLALSWTSQGG
jgi:hypothetical protein